MAGEGEKVTLNVYDLSQGLARQLSTTFLGKAIEGIWHTGIVAYGHEYYFGGGIQSCPEGKAPYGKPMKVIELGWTQVPKEMFEEYLQEISPRYTAATYSLLKHNCNNFSDEISQFLVGIGIPQYILQLPQDVMGSPMGALIMPMIQQFETILRYGGVPQAPHMAMPQAVPNFSQIQLPSIPFSSEQSSISYSTASQKPSFGHAATTTVPPAVMPSDPFDSEVLSTTKGIEPSVKEASEPKAALVEARSRVQQEITREFTILMAEGSLRASEAAALATRRVMERYNRGPDVTSQS